MYDIQIDDTIQFFQKLHRGGDYPESYYTQGCFGFRNTNYTQVVLCTRKHGRNLETLSFLFGKILYIPNGTHI